MKNVIVLPWNDADACEETLEREAGNLAALLVDPLLGIGGIILLIFMILPGTPGPNEFGPEPAAVPAAA